MMGLKLDCGVKAIRHFLQKCLIANATTELMLSHGLVGFFFFLPSWIVRPCEYCCVIML